MDQELEQEEIDLKFEEQKQTPATVPTLTEVINNYIQKVIATMRPHQKQNPLYQSPPEELLFKEQRDSEDFYKGFIDLNLRNRRIQGQTYMTLYITHVMISPRGGNILDKVLKDVLLQNEAIDAVYIEAILSDHVLDRFVAKGWTQDGYGNSVYLLKDSKKSKHNGEPLNSDPLKRIKISGGSKRKSKRKNVSKTKSKCKRKKTHKRAKQNCKR